MKTVDDLHKLMDIEEKGKLAAELGKGASAYSNWKKNGVPDSVYELAVRLSAESRNKKADLDPIEAALIGMIHPVSDEKKREIFMAAAKIISDESTPEK